MADLIEREKQQQEARSTELTVRPPVSVPPREETPTIVRWIQWSVVVAAVGALVVAAFVLGGSDDGAESTLVPLGERYTVSGFDVGFRWIGESGSTIEQIEELTTAPLVPMGERYTNPNFDVGDRFVGESDWTLEELEGLWSLMAADVVADQAMWDSLLGAEGATQLAESLSPGPLEGLSAADIAAAARMTALAEAYGVDMSG